MPFTWITFAQAVAALQGRLVNATFWSSAECQVYLTEALRAWNAFTEQWNADFVVSTQGSQWMNFGVLNGSPRLRTNTDVNLYTQMQYMLLEPPTGGTWSGTKQFDIAAFSATLQRRQDEVIQASGCNLAQLPPLNVLPGTRRTLLPDTTLEPIRNRFLGVMASTTGIAGSGSTALVVGSTIGLAPFQVVTGTNIAPGTYALSIVGSTVNLSLPTVGAVSGTVQFFQALTMTREDTQAFQYFEPAYLQTFAFPESWSVPSEPPLAFDVDNAPNVPGTYDMVAIQSGTTFGPPTPTVLSVPDDWSWLPMYGALADLLGSESERTDSARAQYCLKRFTEGLQVMRKSNWLVNGNVNGVACDTPSLFTHDWTSPEWQVDPNAWPALIQAGIDFAAASPVASQSIGVTLVGNAPVTGQYVQVSRDVFDVILSYAQHLASFKQAGEEFLETMPLYQDFQRAAVETNRRLLDVGIFTDVLRSAGRAQLEAVPR